MNGSSSAPHQAGAYVLAPGLFWPAVPSARRAPAEAGVHPSVPRFQLQWCSPATQGCPCLGGACPGTARNSFFITLAFGAGASRALVMGLGDAGWAQPRRWWSQGRQGAAREPPQDSAFAGRGVSGMPVLCPTEGREMGTSSWGVWGFLLPADGLAMTVHVCLSCLWGGSLCRFSRCGWGGDAQDSSPDVARRGHGRETPRTGAVGVLCRCPCCAGGVEAAAPATCAEPGW